jgi:hypothetical protein
VSSASALPVADAVTTETGSDNALTPFHGPIDMSWYTGPHKLEVKNKLNVAFGLCKYAFLSWEGCPRGTKCLLRHHWFTNEETRLFKSAGGYRFFKEEVRHFYGFCEQYPHFDTTRFPYGR